MAHLVKTNNTELHLHLGRNEVVGIIQGLIKVLGLGYGEAPSTYVYDDNGDFLHRIIFEIDSPLVSGARVTIPAPAADSEVTPIKE